MDILSLRVMKTVAKLVFSVTLAENTHENDGKMRELMAEKSDAKVLAGFVQHLESTGCSPGTIKNYTRSIREFAEWLKHSDGDLTRLTRIDVQQYIYVLEQKGNAAVTIENKCGPPCLF